MKTHNLRTAIHMSLMIGSLFIIVGLGFLFISTDESTPTPTYNGWEVQCNTGCTAKLKNPPAGVEKAEITVSPGEGGSAHATIQVIATTDYTLESVGVKILATGLTSGEKTFYRLVGRSWEQVPATEVTAEPLAMIRDELGLLSSHPRYEWLKRLQ